MKKIVNLTTRKEMSKALARRYQKVRKREKTEILDVFVEMTGYHRVYARWLLRNWGRKIEIRGKEGKRIILVGEAREKDKTQQVQGIRRRSGKSYSKGVPARPDVTSGSRRGRY